MGCSTIILLNLLKIKKKQLVVLIIEMLVQLYASTHFKCKFEIPWYFSHIANIKYE